MKYYIVSEQELRELLRGYFYALALENGGVDDWQWESESRFDFIDGYNSGNNTECVDLDEIAEDALKAYEEAQIF